MAKGTRVYEHEWQLKRSDGEITRAVGRRVRLLREAAGWSQAELERRADVAVGVVNRLESDAGSSRKMISVDVLVRLAEALEAPLDLLVYGKIFRHKPAALLSGGATPDVWLQAPGGTRASRLRVVSRPVRKAQPQPSTKTELPAKSAPRKRAKKPDR